MKNLIIKGFFALIFSSSITWAKGEKVNWFCSLNKEDSRPVSQAYNKVDWSGVEVVFKNVIEIKTNSKIKYEIVPKPSKSKISIIKQGRFEISAEVKNQKVVIACYVDQPTGGALQEPEVNPYNGMGGAPVTPQANPYNGMGGAPPDPMKFGGGKKTPAQPAPKKADEQKKKTATKG